MLRFLIALAIIFALALGFHWLNDASGEVTLTLGDTAYAMDLPIAVIALVGAMLLAIGLIWFVREIFRAPWRMAQGWRRRNRVRGREAVSRGLIAIAAGDVRAAERAALEAGRRVPDQPLTLLLQAQAAQMQGEPATARRIFQAMTEEPATRIAGLRGLYVEAEREGAREAARQIAERAREEAPSAPWAARAMLAHQTAASDWDGALATLSGATGGRILDRRTARRQRAIILAAKARDSEAGDPDVARQAATDAHELAPDLVPAAVLAGRLYARQGDVRRAARILEMAWKAAPHPELADAYVHVRAGDSAGDRLKRAEKLLAMRPHADEARHAVARAAIDARDFSRARDVLMPILTGRPTQKALFLMAELEEAESGDRGRAREWLARAAHAPRDPAWTADGMVLEEWAPLSPVSSRLDGVEWKVPVEEPDAPPLAIDAAELQPLAPARPSEESSPTRIFVREDDAPRRGAPPAELPPVLLSAPAASPAAAAAPALALRSNGAGAASAAAEPPAQPPRPPLLSRTSLAAAATDIAVTPPIPDDPGVGGEDFEEEEERRRGLA